MSNEAVQAYQGIMHEDAQLEKIFVKYLELDTEDNKSNAGYQAWGYSAVGAALILANLIISAKRNTPGRNYRALCDVSFKLNSNDFWVKSSPFLMPLVVVSLNAVKDDIVLREDAKTLQQMATYDSVIRGSQMIALEIFVGILYLVAGEEAMARLSTPMKLDLAPYFVS